MSLDEIRRELNKKFVYTSDNGMDTWSVLETNADKIYGDCEDYVLTFVWMASDDSTLKFLWNLIFMRFVMWYAISPNDSGHAVLYVRDEEKFIDNIQQNFYTKQEFKDKGYKFVFPYASILVLPKLLLSYIIRLFK